MAGLAKMRFIMEARSLIVAPLFLLLGSVCFVAVEGPDLQASEVAEVVAPSRISIDVEGWTVRVHERLWSGPDRELGDRCIRFLAAKLADIKAVVPADKLTRLRAVVIVLDHQHDTFKGMAYHPSATWLANHGHSPDLARCVHIAHADKLPTPRNIREQPWVILHELAHAYEHQVLRPEDRRRITKVYEAYKASGRGRRVLLFNGKRVKHYALTNEKEFFAEMTEAYFGVNDFFPFNRAQLMESEPQIYELLRDIWDTPAPEAECHVAN